MKFIEVLSFRNKLCLLLFVPILGILYFASSGIMDKYQFVTAMQQVEVLAKMSIKVSALVHETQKERGTTAIYMTSRGKRYSQLLVQQHKETDRRLQQLNTFFNGASPDANNFRAINYGDEFQQAVSHILKNMDKVSSIRKRAIGFEEETNNIIAFYSQLNADLLALLDKIPNLSIDARVAMMSNSYVSFLRAKELTGIERAVIGSILSAGNQVSQQDLGINIKKAITLIAKQDAFYTSFRVAAPQESIKALKGLNETENVGEVNKIRARIFSDFLATGANLFAVNVDTWFEAISKKINGLKQIENIISSQLLQLAQGAKEQANRALIFYSLIVVVMILLTLILSVLVIRTVLGQIGGEPSYVSIFAKKIASGDLSSHERSSHQSGLSACVWQISSKLREVVLNVKQGTENSFDSAESLSYETAQMSSVIDSQSMRSNQVASAIGQMSQTIIDVANNTSDIAQSAVGVRQSTDQAKKIINQSEQETRKVRDIVVNTESNIKVLSEKIVEVNKVVDVINKIADQTNLLALNAAIEAARAGEHGRGFAVVADEVRSLAVNTVNSTQEIEQMINEVQHFAKQAVDSIHQSQSMVVRGVEFANEAAATIDNVVGEMNSLQGMVEQVAGATEELSVVSESVMVDVQAISEHSQTMNISFQSVSTTAIKLKNHSSELVSSVSYFSL